jgi:uncharacterized protein YegP (UPF0339 family)
MSSEQKNDTPQTVQTVQRGRDNEPFFEVAEDSAGKWHWLLWSGNGREMARNAVPYEKKKDVIQAIKSLQSVVAKARYIVKSHA